MQTDYHTTRVDASGCGEVPDWTMHNTTGVEQRTTCAGTSTGCGEAPDEPPYNTTEAEQHATRANASFFFIFCSFPLKYITSFPVSVSCIIDEASSYQEDAYWEFVVGSLRKILLVAEGCSVGFHDQEKAVSQWSKKCIIGHRNVKSTGTCKNCLV